MKRQSTTASILCVLLTSVSPAAVTEEGIEFFEKKIRPVLVEHCYGCHSSEAKSVKGGLLLDSRAGVRTGGDSGAAVIPGNVDESLLLSAISYEDYEMPPKGKLPDSVVADFTRWVQMGAPDPRRGEVATPSEIDLQAGRQYWAFQPVADPTTPDTSSAWPHDPLDRFVLARLEQEGLTPVQDADRSMWLRRVTFDLTGLPPTAEQRERFLADQSPGAKQRVVDRLLDSDRYGERWGRHWLDVARYAESTGRSRNFPFHFAWRYRDYVIDSYNNDKPYDQFVVEQLAGDLLPHDSSGQFQEQQIATGFLAMGSPDLNQRDRDIYQMDIIADQIDTTSRAILALTVGCARCHDHKFDPIPTTDYYALAGIFKSTDVLNGYTNRQGGGNYLRGDLLIALDGKRVIKQPSPDELLTRGLPESKASKLIQARQQRDEAAKQFNSIRRNKKLTADERRQQLAEARKLLTNKTQQFNRLRNRFNGQRKVEIEGPACQGVRDSQDVSDCRVHIRGDTKKLGQPVPRGFLSVIADTSVRLPDSKSGRMELARWVASPDNPLTARVMVNRIWHHLFGRGLVRTVDNFGLMGATPSHPQLLDHLASRFMADGWSVKRLIRDIVLSRTYGLDIAYDAHHAAVDADNRLLWRMNPRRLDFESLRDSMLLVSGQLDATRPAASPVEKLAAREIGRRQNFDFKVQDFKHRSLYLPVLRGKLPEEMMNFDFPDPTEVRGSRDVTTVPTQSLFLLNSRFVIDVAKETAGLLIGDGQLSDDKIAKAAYVRLLGREAEAAEVERLEAYAREKQAVPAVAKRPHPRTKEMARHAVWTEIVHAMIASAEFRYR